MTDLDKLAACERVTEWLDPWDNRLEIATGLQSPNRGCTLRQDWWIEEGEEEQLAGAVKRLIVPRAIGSRVLAKVTGDLDWNRVILQLDQPEDWEACVPIESDKLLTLPDGRKAWAGVGLCGNMIGLAVFSQELQAGDAEIRVQRVPDEEFAAILSA